jgi:hypothetical protein
VKKVHPYFLLATLLVLLASCEEKKHQLGDCFSIGDPNNGGMSTGWDYEIRSFNYNKPVFNPSNPNEFAYLYVKDEGVIVEMRLHNLSNGTDNVICNKAPYYMLRFSLHGHLLFNWVDNQPWSVKTDGDSLRQLTSQPYMSLYPDWTDNGNAFIYYSDGGVGNSRFIKADNNGNTIDTLNFITIIETLPHVCSPDGKYIAISVGTTQKYIYDLQLETLKIVTHADYNSATYFMSFSTNGNKLVWVTNEGVHLTDISSEQTYIVKQSCESKQYSHASISSDEQTIIAMRSDKLIIDPNTLYLETNIVRMDVDGSNEQLILLPQ